MIEEVTELPRALPLKEWSQREYSQPDGPVIVRKSAHTWTLLENGEILLILGVYEPTFMTVPEVWLLMCHGFNKQLRRNLIYIKSRFGELLDLYPRLEVKVDSNYLAGLKFARHMGFRQIAEVKMNDGRDYIIFEVRRGR